MRSHLVTAVPESDVFMPLVSFEPRPPLRGGPDGTIQFEFKQMNEEDVAENTRKDYKDEFIHSCFVENSSTYAPEGASCPMK